MSLQDFYVRYVLQTKWCRFLTFGTFLGLDVSSNQENWKSWKIILTVKSGWANSDNVWEKMAIQWQMRDREIQWLSSETRQVMSYASTMVTWAKLWREAYVGGNQYIQSLRARLWKGWKNIFNGYLQVVQSGGVITVGRRWAVEKQFGTNAKLDQWLVNCWVCAYTPSVPGWL